MQVLPATVQDKLFDTMLTLQVMGKHFCDNDFLQALTQTVRNETVRQMA
jgi:hypothetical protein